MDLPMRSTATRRMGTAHATSTKRSKNNITQDISPKREAARLEDMVVDLCNAVKKIIQQLKGFAV